MRKFLALISLKSKTVNITALVAAIITIAQQFGYELSPEVVTAIFTVLAVIMRWVTDTALEYK